MLKERLASTTVRSDSLADLWRHDDDSILVSGNLGRDPSGASSALSRREAMHEVVNTIKGGQSKQDNANIPTKHINFSALVQ